MFLPFAIYSCSQLFIFYSSTFGVEHAQFGFTCSTTKKTYSVLFYSCLFLMLVFSEHLPSVSYLQVNQDGKSVCQCLLCCLLLLLLDFWSTENINSSRGSVPMNCSLFDMSQSFSPAAVRLSVLSVNIEVQTEDLIIQQTGIKHTSWFDVKSLWLSSKLFRLC